MNPQMTPIEGRRREELRGFGRSERRRREDEAKQVKYSLVSEMCQKLTKPKPSEVSIVVAIGWLDFGAVFERNECVRPIRSMIWFEGGSGWQQALEQSWNVIWNQWVAN